MLKIESLAQLAALERCFSKEMYRRLCTRLEALRKTYGACDASPPARFSLAELGPICFVQSWEEIASLSFESVWLEEVGSEALFVALRLTNNEYCEEYWIPHSILTHQQRQRLYRECG